MRWALALAAALPCVITALPPARGAEATVDFERDVRPILEAACVRCHNPTLAKPKGGYRMDTRELAFKGGRDSAKAGLHAVVPGQPEHSFLVMAVEAAQPDEDRHLTPMPPKKEERRLSAAEKSLLRRWVAEGAAWPDGATLKYPPPSPAS